MTTQVPTDMLNTAPAAVVRRDLWFWTAPVALAVAGALHLQLVLSAAFTGNGFVQTFVLLVGLGQIAAACYLGGLRIAGARPDLPTLVLVLAGTTALAVLDAVAHTTGLLVPLSDHAAHHSGHLVLGAATVVAEVVAVLALATLLPAPWPRRARDLLLGLGASVWLLWLVGVLG
jgi:hypothetical protein